MSERFAQGSQEIIEYRGRSITVWRSFERWYYRIGYDGPFQAFKTRDEAIWDAKVRISGKTSLLGQWDIFGSRIDLDNPTPDDRKARLREWLETVTVENGFTAAEEATAKEKLASM